MENLPVEVHDQILDNLDLPKPLFRPVYGKTWEWIMAPDKPLENKYQQYWGPPRTSEQNRAVVSLLNLASTSHKYQKMLAPTIYETLVLKPTTQSVALIKAIQQTKNWDLVKHLIICGVYDESSETERAEEKDPEDVLMEYERQIEIEEGLILSHDLSHGNDILRAATKRLDAAANSASRDSKSVGEKPDSSGSPKRKKQRTRHRDEELQRKLYPTTQIDFDAFTDVLAKLPPNLQCLTLDFPTQWLECFEAGDYLDVFFHETAQEIVTNEESNAYRKQFRTVLRAITSQTNIKILRKCSDNEAGLEVRFFNMPPFSSSVFPGALEYPCAKKAEESEAVEGEADSKDKDSSAVMLKSIPPSNLPELLRLVTSFTFSCCAWDNGAGWHMNTNTNVQSFSASLPTFIFNHLSNKCHTLKFECDETWVLGDFRTENTSWNPLPLDTEGHLVASEYEERHIPLPGFSADACDKLKHLEVDNAFIGREILNFVTARKSTIETVKLHNCWAPFSSYNGEEEDPAEHRTWASFFNALVKAKCPRLKHVMISYNSEASSDIQNQMKEATGRNAEEKEDKRDGTSIEINVKVKGDAGNTESTKQEPGSFVFGYADISDKYGDCLANDVTVPERWEKGDDWKAWLNLRKSMQEK